jgi:glutamine amidotransferase
VKVALVPTGRSNLRSVEAALRRCGASPFRCSDPAVVRNAELVAIPGVGSFAAGMSGLFSLGLDTALRQRALDHRPLLGICLGFQLFCQQSEESPGVSGMGIVNARLERFTGQVAVPQMGWNTVSGSGGLVADGCAYFANSYRLRQPPMGWNGSTAFHGERFVAALESGPMLLCQFHPELSGDYGAELLLRWLKEASA